MNPLRAAALISLGLAKFARHPIRASMQQIEAFGNSAIGGYNAGKLNHLTKWALGSRANENGIPREHLQRIRWAARDLFRNNPDARKICRTLQAKVIGRGLEPRSATKLDDGSPHEEFRKRAKKLWDHQANRLDYRGRPGYGGQTLEDLEKTALLQVMLGGDCLFRYRPMGYRDWRRSGYPAPLQLQLIASDRLAEYSILTDSPEVASPGNKVFRGIEIDQDGIRQAYWILRGNPGDPLQSIASMEADRVPADQCGHLYIADDVDQYRGVSWFAALLMQMRDVGDYQYNELKASAIAACVALGIRNPTGSTQPFGLQPPTDPDPSTTMDSDGNPLTTIQPGMIVQLGQDGKLEGFNPARPNTNAEAWINHLLRRTAAGVPGVKSSTVTGDYRQSSFSSERSADNDAWPELEGLQDWFAHNFCQPLYEQLIESAVITGFFDDLLTPEEFADDRQNFLHCHWQGPVALSINPVDDARAAQLRIEQGVSTVQQEAAKVGRDWHDVFADIAEVITYARQLQLPEDLIRQIVGLAPLVIAQEERAQGTVDENNVGKAAAKPAVKPQPALTQQKQKTKRSEAWLDDYLSPVGVNGQDLSRSAN